MAQTDNLNMEIVPTSDFVSPEPFNSNFKKLDALGKDYVIETGTSGEWWYRKWKSGRAECGVDSKQFSDAGLNKWGPVAMTNVNWSFGAYPFTFSKRPNVNINFLGDQNAGYGGIIHIRGRLTGSSALNISPTFVIMDPVYASGTIYQKPEFSIFVTGLYK